MSCQQNKDETFNTPPNAHHASSISRLNEIPVALDDLITQLPSQTYSCAGIQQFIAILNQQAGVTATLVCCDCIKTNPAQSEVRISVAGNVSTVTKVIDLSVSATNTMKIVGVHD